ncbi:MAG: hypothetical protein ACT4OO_03270 [Nitrospiraceae bacterium]
MTKGSKSFKRLFAAFVAVSAIAIAGTPNQAHALGFPNGDLALVVYGGDTEY